MEIFGVGAAEILVVALLLLIVAGPKRSAEWAREAGRYVSQIRMIWQRMMQDLRDEIGEDANEIIKTAQQIQKTALDVKKVTSPKKIAETTVKLAEHADQKHREAATESANGNGSAPRATDYKRYGAWQPKSVDEENKD